MVFFGMVKLRRATSWRPFDEFYTVFFQDRDGPPDFFRERIPGIVESPSYFIRRLKRKRVEDACLRCGKKLFAGVGVRGKPTQQLHVI